eukprot:sb/3474556/
MFCNGVRIRKLPLVARANVVVACFCVAKACFFVTRAGFCVARAGVFVDRVGFCVARGVMMLDFRHITVGNNNIRDGRCLSRYLAARCICLNIRYISIIASGNHCSVASSNHCGVTSGNHCGWFVQTTQVAMGDIPG